MALNRGKQWETKVKENLKSSFPGSFVYRIPDQQNGFYGSTNICDFLVFTKGKLLLIEAKTTKGNTFSLTTFSQYDKLLACKVYEGVLPYVIIWYSEKDLVIAVHISEIEKMKQDGCKSINIKMLSDGKYKIIKVPSVKKRVFLDCNYKCLIGQ